MRCLASSATAMFTPASAYFMEAVPFSWRAAERPASFSPPGSISTTGAAGIAGGTRGRQPAATSKRAKDASPANHAWVQHGIDIGVDAFADLAGLPGIRRNIERHINQDRSANDVFARDNAPETAVVGIGAVIAHDEIRIGRDFERAMEIVRFGRTQRVFLDGALAINPNGTIMNLDRIARQADHALDVVRGIGGEGRLEDDDLLAFWIAPEGDMQIGEGHTGVVSDAAHDEVVADEQRVLHGAGGNHASLADGAVDEEECESDPEPGDNLALNSGLDGQMRLGWRRLLLHFGFG